MLPNNRRHERLTFQGTIFIEKVARGLGSHEGEVVVCQTIEISHSGLRVHLKHELKVGVILQIGVELSASRDTLYLAGEVAWCRPDDERPGEWFVGFELLNADDSDIEAWRSTLIDMGST